MLSLVSGLAVCLLMVPVLMANSEAGGQFDPFPALIPAKKPDGPLSAATGRLYDRWNPHEDRANELFSNFKYSPLEGLSYEGNVSRRDPTKVLKINGMYHVWYTHRRTEAPPAGPKRATNTIPSTDWDLADIWHATSQAATRMALGLDARRAYLGRQILSLLSGIQ